MFIVIGFLVGCVMAWLIINYVSDNLLYLVRIFLYLGTIYVLITSIKMFFNKTLTIEYCSVLNKLTLSQSKKE